MIDLCYDDRIKKKMDIHKNTNITILIKSIHIELKKCNITSLHIFYDDIYFYYRNYDDRSNNI